LTAPLIAARQSFSSLIKGNGGIVQRRRSCRDYSVTAIEATLLERTRPPEPATSIDSGVLPSAAPAGTSKLTLQTPGAPAAG